MKTTRANTRRNFLLATGLGGAAAAAAVVATRKAAPAKPGQAASEPAASGYRTTAHIEKYYKTTEV